MTDGNVVNENTVDDKDGKNLEPFTRLEFDTQDDAYFFYLKYAKYIVFGILKKSSHRSMLSREFIYAKFTCTRYGIKQESNAINQSPCLKVDCKALLHVKRNSCGKWYAQNFIKEQTMNFILAMHIIFHATELLHLPINIALICYMQLVLVLEVGKIYDSTRPDLIRFENFRVRIGSGRE